MFKPADITTGVGAGTFLGVRKIFPRIHPTLPNNLTKKDTSEKSCSKHFGRNFSQMKAYWAPFLADIFREFA